MSNTLESAAARAAEPREGTEPLVRLASAALPSRFGQYRIVAFRDRGRAIDHVAVVHGEVAGRESVKVRLHSECLTGDVLGSLRCDCRAQLEMSLEALAAEERGVLLYLRQEGRGIGLANKIRAYALQDLGLDTFEANRHLGFDDDLRDYGIAARMLQCLGVASVVVLTNNPRKLEGLRENGVRVEGRLPIEAAPTLHNERYLRAKKLQKGHLLDLCPDGAGVGRVDGVDGGQRPLTAELVPATSSGESGSPGTAPGFPGTPATPQIARP